MPKAYRNRTDPSGEICVIENQGSLGKSNVSGNCSASTQRPNDRFGAHHKGAVTSRTVHKGPGVALCLGAAAHVLLRRHMAAWSPFRRSL